MRQNVELCGNGLVIVSARLDFFLALSGQPPLFSKPPEFGSNMSRSQLVKNI